MARQSFGDRSQFAIEVGDFDGDTDALRRVDVWAAGIWLTCIDNTVYVPHFAGCLQHDVGYLLADPTRRNRGRRYPELSFAENYRRLRAGEDDTDFFAYRFMDWGPTADNVEMLLFREGEIAYLAFEVSRQDSQETSESRQVFLAELPERELALVLHTAAWFLIWAWADRSKWPTPAEPTAAPERDGE